MLSALAKMHNSLKSKRSKRGKVGWGCNVESSTINSPMRIVAVEALDEILVLVVDVPTIASMIVMRLLLLPKALHSVIHVAWYGTAAGVDIRTSLHLLCVHCDGVIWVHYRTLELPLHFSSLFKFLKWTKRKEKLKVLFFASFKYFFLQRVTKKIEKLLRKKVSKKFLEIFLQVFSSESRK